MDSFLKISNVKRLDSLKDMNEPYYFILLLDGYSSFSVDFNEYAIQGKNMLFLSPYQILKWHADNQAHIRILRFHGDFYCIEYHKAEVACNGILFNNIYDTPLISIEDSFFKEIDLLFNKIEVFESATIEHDLSIARSYLQLVLALCSREKMIKNKIKESSIKIEEIHSFKPLLDAHFSTNRSVDFYAQQLSLSVNAFSKKVKKHYGKTPTKLIQEKIILEAKRLLHLTYKSIKIISFELGFEDEFYFSRYFKKEVGVSPKTFRDRVGISIVAEKSM